MSDSLETAIIAMVLQGDALVSQKAAQVTVDLTSAERSGRSAEKAARDAQRSFSTLTDEVVRTTEKLHLAVHVAERLARSAGIESPALEAFAGRGGALSTGLAAQRLLAPLDAFLPGASLVGGIAAGAYTGVRQYEKVSEEYHKRDEELARKAAAETVREMRDSQTSSVGMELIRQAALARFDHTIGPRTIQ